MGMWLTDQAVGRGSRKSSFFTYSMASSVLIATEWEPSKCWKAQWRLSRSAATYAPGLNFGESSSSSSWEYRSSHSLRSFMVVACNLEDGQLIISEYRVLICPEAKSFNWEYVFWFSLAEDCHGCSTNVGTTKVLVSKKERTRFPRLVALHG
jgi:hypothetical protein